MLVLAPVLALATLAAAPPRRACLNVASSSSTQYHPVDDHTIVIEDGRRWFRLVVTPTFQLTDPSAAIINEVRGSSWLCDAIDFDLSVTTPPGGFREPMIAQSFAEIPPAEGKALVRTARR